MRKHQIHVEQSKDGTWIAYKEKTKHFNRDTEEKHALAGLASKIKIKIWNEN